MVTANEVKRHAIDPRVSSVPDREFERPQTPDELFRVASLACDILYAVATHLLEDDPAWQEVNKLHVEAVAAHSWIHAGKWIGLSEWQKRDGALAKAEGR